MPRVRVGAVDDPDDSDDADGDPSEADPGEPVVSATAIGIDANAEPTPSATASAPTRPTNRAYPDVAGSVSDVGAESIPRIPFDERAADGIDWGVATGLIPPNRGARWSSMVLALWNL